MPGSAAGTSGKRRCGLFRPQRYAPEAGLAEKETGGKPEGLPPVLKFLSDGVSNRLLAGGRLFRGRFFGRRFLCGRFFGRRFFCNWLFRGRFFSRRLCCGFLHRFGSNFFGRSFFRSGLSRFHSGRFLGRRLFCRSLLNGHAEHPLSVRSCGELMCEESQSLTRWLTDRLSASSEIWCDAICACTGAMARCHCARRSRAADCRPHAASHSRRLAD